jgi:hypothetical protein
MRAADFLFGGAVDLTRAHLPENREALAFDIDRETGVAELVAALEEVLTHTEDQHWGLCEHVRTLIERNVRAVLARHASKEASK